MYANINIHDVSHVWKNIFSTILLVCISQNDPDYEVLQNITNHKIRSVSRRLYDGILFSFAREGMLSFTLIRMFMCSHTNISWAYMHTRANSFLQTFSHSPIHPHSHPHPHPPTHTCTHTISLSLSRSQVDNAIKDIADTVTKLHPNLQGACNVTFVQEGARCSIPYARQDSREFDHLSCCRAPMQTCVNDLDCCNCGIESPVCVGCYKVFCILLNAPVWMNSHTLHTCVNRCVRPQLDAKWRTTDPTAPLQNHPCVIPHRIRKLCTH